MRIWHDWEFFEDGRIILPISVGMYREIDEAELYHVFSNVDPFLVQQNSWLLENVWPKLNRTGDGPINWNEDYVQSKPEIRRAITEFIGASSIYGEEVQLWGDFCAYDHVALAQLWGPMTGLPSIIPMHTNDLRTEIARRGLSDAQLPPGPSTRHNALADAKHEALVMRFLETYDRIGESDQERLISAAVEGRWPEE